MPDEHYSATLQDVHELGRPNGYVEVNAYGDVSAEIFLDVVDDSGTEGRPVSAACTLNPDEARDLAAALIRAADAATAGAKGAK